VGKSFVSDIPAGDGENDNFFYSVVQREIKMSKNQPIGNDFYDPSGFIMSPREIVSGFPILECFLKDVIQTLKAC
jgi:hypothetical protein